MPNSNRQQTGRREAIIALLQNGPAGTQQSLVDALVARGFVATQSSVSRDLREMGALKTADGYRLPQASTGDTDEMAAVAGLVRDLKPAGPNLLVILTATGAAQRVALALDRSAWPEIVGSVGGDDTVFTATVSATAQRNIVARIERSIARA